MALYASKMMRVAAIAATTALALSACGKGDEKAAGQQAQGSQQQQNSLRLKSVWLLCVRKPLH